MQPRSLRSLLPLLALLSLGACAMVPAKPKVPRLTLDVSSLAGDPAALAGPHTLGLGAPAGEEPLVDQRFMQAFREALGKKGVHAEDAQPQWVLQASHSISPVEEPLPDKKERENYWKDGNTRIITRYRNGVPYTEQVTSPGNWAVREKVIHGGMRMAYDLKVTLRVYAAPLSPSALPLWEGTLLTRQLQADAPHWAPLLMRELAREFPRPSKAPSHRSIALESPAPDPAAP